MRQRGRANLQGEGSLSPALLCLHVEEEGEGLPRKREVICLPDFEGGEWGKQCDMSYLCMRLKWKYPSDNDPYFPKKKEREKKESQGRK